MSDSNDSKESEETASADTDDQSYASGAEERQAHYPDVGYNEIEINLGRPPGNALATLRHHLRLSAIRLLPATEFEDYVVYDRHGNGYGHKTLNKGESDGTDSGVAELVETTQSGDARDRRVALLRLADLAEEKPEACLDVLPQLTTTLQTAEPAEQAEALHILSLLAEEFPEQVTPAADEVIKFLTVDRHADIQKDGISFVKAVAERNPGAVVDAVPRLAALLQDGPPAKGTAMNALTRIAKIHPDAVVPVVPQLVTYIEEGDDVHRVGGLAVLGMVSKEYPQVAEDIIPTARSLLDAEDDKVRTNATGLLADFADEYPDEIRPTVPRAVELLSDEEERVRYNATSILARVARKYPGEVEAGIPPLIDSLDDDNPYTRSNACWALGYMASESALERLEELIDTDPDEEVRNAAAFAVSEIQNK